FKLDIDECTITNPCLNGGTCFNFPGGFFCSCLPGYTSTNCELEIDECASLPCQNGGQCNDLVNGYTCTCVPGYTGSHCSININECASDPCLNGGTCVDGINQYICLCVFGFEGTHCEINIDDCSLSSCLNQGTCVDGVNSFSCICMPGYIGNDCGIDINECASDPCVNGVCLDGVNGYICQCFIGYIGLQCEINTNECDSDPCLNGATCVDQVDGYQCVCVPGYSGVRCEIDINDCLPNPCVNGACVDAVNAYVCVCIPGYTGVNCETNIDECASNPCRNGATCLDAVNGYFCNCVLGYSGIFCQINIDECAPGPCQNGGTCFDAINAYFCSCVQGYTGTNCEIDINECASSPCQNGGTCLDGVNQYVCQCPIGFTGQNCEEDLGGVCFSNPCINGATCFITVDGYTCGCLPGYTGLNCQININECASGPCQNGGTCVDGVNGYVCNCVPGYTGSGCQINIDECASLPCQNGGTCLDGVNGYLCICASGFTGLNCNINIDECTSGPCQNGGTCIDVINGYFCNCAPGYTGTFCQTDIDGCATSPCINGGTCIDTLGGYTCACLAGYTGINCQTNIDECASGPCQNGGTCFDGVNGYVCSCVLGYTGTFCQININECASDPCQNGGTCIDAVNGYVCNCALGYTGVFCQINIDECASGPCQNGGTCLDIVNGYFCNCAAGYTGRLCDIDIDGCATSPCINGGTCIDTLGGYTCACLAGYTGINCQTNIDECASGPCQNGGTCFDGVNGYVCSCVLGYTGTLCQININECASDPCQNGGTCLDAVNGYVCNCALGYTGVFCQINLVNGYFCNCVPGYTGTFCQINIDECASGPCQNGGTCLDIVNGYFCNCAAGYTGRLCDIDIDGCATSPCINGGTCIDTLGGYTCACLAGYTGINCQTNIDECASGPCQNGGTCFDAVNGYFCNCPAGYTGIFCQINIDECASLPCQNGGTCLDAENSYVCNCVPGYTGISCETNVDECASLPCLNGGTCLDLVNRYFCQCPVGYAGPNCEIDLGGACFSDPCENGGTCVTAPNGYFCVCPLGYSGQNCEIDIDACLSDPCLNGVCFDLPNGYFCSCTQGFEGVNCDINTNECLSQPCLNGGTCLDGTASYICVCPAGYSGLRCEVDIDFCSPQPCLNGGQCVDGPTSYSCICPPGYVGVDCEILVDPCASQPCRNGGTCQRLGGFNFICFCTSLYNGPTCEVPVQDPCASQPCANGGTCVVTVEGGFKCVCPGYGFDFFCNVNPDLLCFNRADGNYAHPTNCSIIVACVGGNPILIACPAGLAFNETANLCDQPANVPGCAGIGPVTACSGRADGNYRIPGQCNSFLQCVAGQEYIGQCVAGLAYDEIQDACVQSSLVDGCDTGGTTGTGEFCSGLPDGLYPNVNDCQSFFQCSNGNTFVFLCGENLVYSPSTQQCDSPIEVPGCENFNPGVPNECQGRLDGYYSVSGNCSAILACSGGTPIYLVCPGGLAFNETTDMCERPQNVDGCEGLNNGDFCSSRNDGNYPLSCSSYYSCVFGTSFVLSCQPGLAYNPNEDICDFPQNVPGCEQIVGDPTCLNRVDGNYAVVGNCSAILSCVGGFPFYQVCPVGTVFNESANICDQPANVPGCAVTQPGICGNRPDGNIRNPASCRSYFACVAGQETLLFCPTGLVYNALSMECDFPTNVPGCNVGGGGDPECVGRPNGNYAVPGNCSAILSCFGGLANYLVCPPGLSFNETGNRCDRNVPGCSGGGTGFCANLADGNYVNPTNCSQFISCVGGIPIVQSCPAGLGFNSTGNRCDAGIPGCAGVGSGFCFGREDGNYANPMDCNSYYACSGGVTIDVSCPEGLAFNQQDNECQQPGDVPGCAGTGPGGSPTCVGREDGFYADQTNCNRFYRCVGGVITSFNNCNPGLYFDAVSFSCNLPENVPNCGGGGGGGGICSGRLDGNYRDPQNCNQYIACSGGSLIATLSCQGNLVFNEDDDRCDFPQNVQGCETFVGDGGDPVCSGLSDGNYRVPNNCSAILSCVGGFAFYQVCPAGTVYYNVNDTCTLPANVPGCELPGPTSFCSSLPNGNYQNPASCSSYYACSGGQSQLLACPQGLVYNPTNDACDFASAVAGCSGGDRGDGGGDGACTGIPDGFYRVPQNCSIFLGCSGGIATFLSCPPGLVYNQTGNLCDNPANVPECSGFLIGDGFCSGLSDGNYPDAANCSAYYSCSGGVTNKLACPAGLAYNAGTDQCDLRGNVAGCEVPPPDLCQPGQNGHFADSVDCRRYYICTDGQLGLFTCPPQRAFDPYTCTCIDYTDVPYCLKKMFSKYSHICFCAIFAVVSSTQYTTYAPIEQEHLTGWFNRDSPLGEGDIETLEDLKRENPYLLCDFPFGIECQTTSGVPYTATGQVVKCEASIGLICRNAEQKHGDTCLDYRVRFRCSHPIDECASNPCENGAVCRDRTNAFECICPGGFEGERCEINTDDCVPNQCQNGGACVDKISDYICVCPPGYSGRNCENDIDECIGNKCQNGATCKDFVNGYVCLCAEGYSGLFCEENIDDCIPQPCKNNGRCQDLINDYWCWCEPGYTGQHCEIDIDECSPNPCVEGSCVDGINGYTCDCSTGYRGDVCQINENDCSPDPCVNGICIDGVGDYYCACSVGYEGRNCDINTNDCTDTSCMNGGTCIDGLNGFTCNCPPGYEGMICEHDINECASYPCLNGAMCDNRIGYYTCYCKAGYTGLHCEIDIDDCSPNRCVNGGGCVDLVNDFKCICKNGYTGKLCEIDVDECRSSPCKNGGTCEQTTGGYKCTCVPGFTGNRCEIDIDECASLPCQNGATCINLQNMFWCNCAPGYNGLTCDQEIDECYSQPCQNGATCKDLVDSYQCVCYPGYEGVNCETSVNECDKYPCKHGGICINSGPGTYTCRCPSAWFGKNCQYSEDMFCDHKKNGLYSHWSVCARYFSCSNYQTHKLECQHGLVFNPKGYCDWPANVPGCSDQSNGACSGRQDGLYLYPSNCGKYIQCGGGVEYRWQCQDGLVFNPRTGNCDYPYNVPECSTASQVDDPFCQGKLDGSYKNPADCTTYFICSSGNLQTAGCFFNLVYNEVLKRCDFPYSLIECDQGQSGDMYCIDKSDGNYEYPNDCSKFVQCVSGYSTVSTCLTGLVYDVQKDLCDYPPTTGRCSQVGQTGDFCSTKSAVGLYRDPLNCEKFYQCSNGYTYHHICPAGLVYNEATEKCDYHTNVPGCAAPQVVFDSFCWDKSDGIYPDPGNCNMYYICEYGLAKHIACPLGQAFDEIEFTCNIEKYLTGCKYNGGVHPVCLEPNGYFPDNNYCKGYYECILGVPIRRLECDGDLVFNYNTKKCDSIINVPECRAPDPLCIDRPNGRYPYPNSCTKYFVCQDGFMAARVCSAGLAYNADAMECQTPQGSCFCVGKHDGNYVDTTSCSQYYSCMNGITKRPNCSPGLVYNAAIGTCDSSSNTGPPQCTHQTQYQQDPLCSGKLSGSYGFNQYCDKYYKCVDNVSQIITCVAGHVYNPAIRTCSLPTIVDGPCGVKLQIDDQFCKGKDDGYYEHPTDCNKFYQCYDDITYPQDCQPGLVFNIHATPVRCDYPSEVPKCL
ncbi:fibrillin-2-like, partial [Anneissia japonica]|uniref:fibrillin-2-like n=1 Tax=Anneissia japonica TaxID=1529436 RepID=UPI0014258B90